MLETIFAWTRNNRWLVIGFAFVMSAAAVLGSLYFSEVRGLIPCQLCWYQRIFMYPLPILLGMIGYRKDSKAYVYVLPLALIGMAIGLYHVSMQSAGDAGAFPTCGGGESCSDEPTFWFSWLSIPLGSVLMFLGIAGPLALLYISDLSAKLKPTKAAKK